MYNIAKHLQAFWILNRNGIYRQFSSHVKMSAKRCFNGKIKKLSTDEADKGCILFKWLRSFLSVFRTETLYF